MTWLPWAFTVVAVAASIIATYFAHRAGATAGARAGDWLVSKLRRTK